MTDLSADQLADLQADLGIGDSEGVFTDAALSRLYTRADGDYNLTVTLAIRQLLMNAVRFNDYTSGQSQEKKSQIFDHLKTLLAYWEQKADEVAQVKIVGLRSVPPRERTRPFTSGRRAGRLARRFGNDGDF